MDDDEWKVLINVSQLEFCNNVTKGMASPHTSFNQFETTAIGLLLLLILLLGLVGNVLVLVVVSKYTRLQTLANVYVVSLAVADIVVAVLLMPLEIYLETSNGVWKLRTVTCLFYKSLIIMMCMVLVNNICCLALDRYLAICRPLLDVMTIKIVVSLIIGSWLSPILLSILPILAGWHAIGIEDQVRCLQLLNGHHTCVLMFNVEFASAVSVLAFYLPVVVLLVINVKIFRAAVAVLRQIQPARGNLRHRVHPRVAKTAKTVVALTACFSLCWLPFFVLFAIDPFVGHVFPFSVWSFALWLGTTHSMLNPFMLYAYEKPFGHAFRRLFRNCWICRQLMKSQSSQPMAKPSISISLQPSLGPLKETTETS